MLRGEEIGGVFRWETFDFRIPRIDVNYRVYNGFGRVYECSVRVVISHVGYL